MSWTGYSRAAPIIEARDLSLWHGETRILDDLSLSVVSGEVLQLRGENGSGKTTLLRVLAGLVEPDEGQVLFDGQPLPRAREALNDSLLYVGHRPGVGAALTPVENLLTIAHTGALDGSRIEEVLGELGLGGRLGVPVAALSAGQRRRVALARLALESKRLWILDEPLTALDAGGLAWVAARIGAQARSGGTVLFTTHQPLALPDVGIRTLELGDGATRA